MTPSSCHGTPHVCLVGFKKYWSSNFNKNQFFIQNVLFILTPRPAVQAFIPISAKRAAIDTLSSHSHSVPTVTSGTAAFRDRVSVVQNCCVREITVISVVVPTLITATLIGTDSIYTLDTAVIWVKNLSQVGK